jgi:thiol-disulfide isomerase/thioredoxin
MDNKLLVIDFWATWCPPCRASIPHMNQTAAKFAADVVCVGISNEIKSAFDAGMAKNKLDVTSFTYSLALDPSKKLNSFFKVKAIPSCAVVSSDGIVRWQGHPMTLDDATMMQLVAAQKALSGAAK